MEKSMKGLVCALGVLSLATVQAKTIALWPIDYDDLNKEVNLRCAVNPAYDLTLKDNVAWTNDVPFTGLPSNPDADPQLLFQPPNTKALQSVNNTANEMLSLVNAQFAAAVCSTNTFTIEGWVKLDAVPDSGGWYILVNALKGSGGTGGWIWSLRRQGTDKSKVDFEVYSRDGSSTDGISYETFSISDLPNQWMHVALVHEQRKENGKGEWRFYRNGELKHAQEHDPKTLAGGLDNSFEMGGRSSGTANRLRGALAYWRVSDVALAPGQFLCDTPAEPIPTPVASPTVNYWKLDRRADGTPDGRDYVGTANLDGGFFGDGNAKTRAKVGLESAFAGNPPNTTVTLPSGNAGSLLLEARNSCIQVPNLGAQLEVTNSFTVEGWLKPMRRNAGSYLQYIWNTRISNRGWALQLQQKDGKDGKDGPWQMQLYAEDEGGIIINNVVLVDNLGAWCDWRHLALVYDRAGGGAKGEWRIYFDGALQKAVTNSHDVVGTSLSQHFHLGGREDTEHLFQGYMDCVRVSRAALNPSQFLCATNDPQAATDVLAFWPLNYDTAHGPYFDGRDIAGNYTLAPNRAAQHFAATSTAIPSIANPDFLMGYADACTNLAGSVAFRGTGGNYSYLCSRDSVMLETFRNRSGWTAECYLYRIAACDAWEVIFGLESDANLTAAGMMLNMTYRTNGFVLQDVLHTNTGIADQPFPDASPNEQLNVWRHMALTYHTEGETNAVYELFLDGVSHGTLQSTKMRASPNSSTYLVIGGRAHSANSFRGYISSFRLSNRVLEPNEFLCATGATPPPPVVPETLAYWPLDWNGIALDRTTRLPKLYNLTLGRDFTGQTEQACTIVPQADDSPDFIGNRRANVGSATWLDVDGHLETENLGYQLDLNEAFTVEGWLKWADAASAANEIIAGSYRESKEAGWRLSIVKRDGVPRVRIFARPLGRLASCVIDRVFDADVSAWKDVWTHLALTYDPSIGNGTWTLFADGKELGTVENFWRPNTDCLKQHGFALGGRPSGVTGGAEIGCESVTGALDVWRVSRGVRTPDTFLFIRPRSTIFIVR